MLSRLTSRIGLAVLVVVTAFFTATASVSAFQGTIAEWTFEVSIPATAGPHAAEGGENAGAGSPATGFHAGTTTYSNPVGNGSAESFSSNGWQVGDYYQFCTSSVSYAGISLEWDQTSSGTGPRDFEVQYSVNGGPYTTFGGTYEVLANATPPGFWNGTTYVPDYHFVVDLSSVTALDGQAQICFRLVNNSTVSANGGTVAGTGTDRVDNVQIKYGGTGNPVGACCDGVNCTIETAEDCANIPGAMFLGVGTSCNAGACVGACCDGTNCTVETPAGCAAIQDAVFQGLGTTCTPGLCDPVPTGACCNGATCLDVSAEDCAAISGAIFLGIGTSCTSEPCPFVAPDVKINELRVDQSGNDFDEYLELTGPPGTPLNGLAYIVIGDGTAAQASGVIEHVTYLHGQTIPSDGYWLAAGADGRIIIAGPLNPGGAVPNYVFPINTNIFENSDNVTHMLVAGFTGAVGQDLDTDDNCTLDITPWAMVLDRVALTNNPTQTPPLPAGTECFYVTSPDQLVGPDNTFFPGHVYRLPNATGPWAIGAFNPTVGVDTPGLANTTTGACCQGSFCSEEDRTFCEFNLDGIFKGVGTLCDDVSCTQACCIGSNCQDLDPDTCIAMGGAPQGEDTACDPVPACGVCMTIAEARLQPVGARVKLCNVVISSTLDLVAAPTVKSFQIEDDSGEGGRSGLTVFGPNELIDPILAGAAIGVEIDVQGSIDQFNGLLELADGSLPLMRTRLGPNVGATLPVIISIADMQDGSSTAEGLESEIVTLPCVLFVNAGGTFLGETNYLVTDGQATATVRISTTQQDFQGQLIPSGPVSITGVFSQNDTTVPLDGMYQLLPRDMFGPHFDLNTEPDCGPTGACCVGGGNCIADLPEALCTSQGGLFQGEDSICEEVECPTTDGIVINEIRVDQNGDDLDEYFELKGPANVPIGSLTYIVIGDGTGGSGVIESITPLTGKIMPPDGLFLVAESTFTLGTPDFIPPGSNPLNFENDDNVTHMLVEGFNGALNQDLDTNDDGILDAAPWTRVLDSIALVKNIESPPVGTEWWYGPTVGPNPNNTAPFHVIRCAGALNGWIIGSADLPPTGNDTPGEENDCSNACLTCYGDIDQSQRVDVDDIDEFVDVLLGLEHSVCADVNLDGEINGLDIRRFTQLILANGGAGTSCLPAGQRDVVRCDNADPPSDCPDAPGGYCQYEVEFNQAGLAPCVVTANPGPNQLVEGEIICVPCPDNEVCGNPDDRVRFRWVNHDGLGNDCIFFARLVSSSCTSCPENKRFDDAPPPLAIKIVTWNLLNYGGSGRTVEYQTVLNAIQADIVVAQEVVGTSSANAFLNTVLNGPGGPGGYSMATFVDSPDSDNALYYRSTRIGFSGPGDHTNVAISPRWADRWRVTINGFTGNESQLYVYSAHLKAGNTGGDATDRETAALAVRAHANNLPAGTNFVIVGDMNLYTSAEAAYTAFTGSTGNNNGRVFDPINRPGNWNSNSAFRDIHTQSTHNNNSGAPAGAAIGGLDDRFDFILCSSALLDGVALTYRVGSYHAFGNDGLHFNNDINDPPTIPEGAAVADALHGASDHLPVVMEILLP